MAEALPNPEREARTCQLPDGRRLCYAEYGAPGGAPVLLFHGTPSARLMFRIAHAAGAELDLRLIAPDRPGIGRSDPSPGRGIGDWPADIAVLADHLGFARFAVLGISGGGPYAIACAMRLADRLTAAGVVSGIGPLDVPELWRALRPKYRAIFAVARAGGWPYRRLAGTVAGFVRRWPGAALRQAVRHEPAADRTALAGGAAAAALTAAMVEAFRQGPGGVAADAQLLARPWGFALRPPSVPVLMWHGLRDTIVPPAMAHHLARHLNAAEIQMIADAGHFWGIAHVREILAAVRARVSFSRPAD